MPDTTIADIGTRYNGMPGDRRLRALRLRKLTDPGPVDGRLPSMRLVVKTWTTILDVLDSLADDTPDEIVMDALIDAGLTIRQADQQSN